MDTLQLVLAKYTEYISRRDTMLIGLIEEIEGRVPTNQELAEHCFCGLFPDGYSEFKWKGNTIMVCDKFNHFL